MPKTVLSAVAVLLLLTTGSAERVRLVGGPTPREGRLDVYYNGTWGTVCDNGFTDAAARVVCYMLGYGFSGQFIGNRYGAGSGTIWLDNVRCSYTNRKIAHCQHNGWGLHNCAHSNDVSVSCFDEVRLVGDSGSKGRLEVYHNGTWGTVCVKGFTDHAAIVVCRMLGYGYYGSHGQFTSSLYGVGSGPMWLDNVRCHGSESRITECPHSGWGRHNCSHSDDVSLSCMIDSVEAVALVGGGNPRVGRLEVFHDTQWGTVCDDGFTDAAARVVCYSLGFGYVGRKVDIKLYGEGDGLIWLNNVNCTGTEQYIGSCPHGGWKVQNSYCSHHQDVAVSCIDNSSGANNSDSTRSVTPVRLVGGSGSTGRLEVLHNGVWGTVCGNHFTDVEARVVCKMMEFELGTKIDNRNYTSSHGPIWLDDLRCSGTETDIAECSHNGWGVHDCSHHEDVAVSCARVQVRLNGGRDPREGRLEIFYNGKWGYACDRYGSFGYPEATVVCSMLGFGHIGRPTRRYIITRGPVWLTSIRCTGWEKSIDECTHNGWGVDYYSRCTIDDKNIPRPASLTCLPDDAVALFGGVSPREGRLEVYHHFRWGTVCDDGFTDAAARVACHSLGYGYRGRKVDISLYGTGIWNNWRYNEKKMRIWLDDVHCNGTERHIGDCPHAGWGIHNCTHQSDVAVHCFGDKSATSSTSSASTTPSSASTLSYMSAPISSSHDSPQTIIVASVLGGLVLLVSIVLVVIVVHYRRRLRPERSDEVTLPTHEISSTTNYQNDAFDDIIVLF